MVKDAGEKIGLFNSRLDMLFENVAKWLDEVGIKWKVYERTNHENQSGPYDTKELRIFDADNQEMARLEPYGIWLIGASGRVDLVSVMGREMFVYLKPNGAKLERTISDGKGIIDKTEWPLTEETVEGWYWIDNPQRRKHPPLDKDLFIDLLENAK
ncbi:MAG: hypothetical protein PHW04_12690 [Candidatus Wallbacteria bacterium]|nr:hypothetical protein [Candidatus Wallbacteria bacterium]